MTRAGKRWRRNHQGPHRGSPRAQTGAAGCARLCGGRPAGAVRGALALADLGPCANCCSPPRRRVPPRHDPPLAAPARRRAAPGPLLSLAWLLIPRAAGPRGGGLPARELAPGTHAHAAAAERGRAVPRAAPSREAVDPEWYRRKALALLSATRGLQRDAAWTIFIPGSWRSFDNLEEQVQARFDREFGDIVVETVRRAVRPRQPPHGRAAGARHRRPADGRRMPVAGAAVHGPQALRRRRGHARVPGRRRLRGEP